MIYRGVGLAESTRNIDSSTKCWKTKSESSLVGIITERPPQIAVWLQKYLLHRNCRRRGSVRLSALPYQWEPSYWPANRRRQALRWRLRWQYKQKSTYYLS